MNSELIDLLRTVSSGFRMRMQERMMAQGPELTVFQGRLVNAIGRNEGISQLELGVLVERDKAQIARAVKELEARGLVLRGAHASDWRTKSIALTQEGRRLHAYLNAERQQLAAEVLDSLSEAEKHALRTGLRKMDAALQQKDNLSGKASS